MNVKDSISPLGLQGNKWNIC